MEFIYDHDIELGVLLAVSLVLQGSKLKFVVEHSALFVEHLPLFSFCLPSLFPFATLSLRSHFVLCALGTVHSTRPHPSVFVNSDYLV